MRKNIYKITAIIMAASMMSMTVFAAEDAEAIGQEGSNPEQTMTTSNETEPETPPAQEETLSATSESESGGTTQEQPQNTENPEKPENASSGAGTQEQSSDSGATGGTGAASEGQSGTGAATEEQSSSKESSGTGSSEAAASGSTEGESAADAEKTTEDAEKSAEASSGASGGSKETEEPATRREAANLETTTEQENEESSSSDNSQVNWSNGEVKDVMGVKSQTNDDGTVTISYKVKHVNDWDNYAASNPITVTITTADGKTEERQITIGHDGVAHGLEGNNGYATIGSISKSSEQTDTETLEITIPASWFGTDSFTVSSGEYTATNNAPQIADNNNVGEDAVYEGVSIDGDFSDWNAVSMVEMPDPTDYNGAVQSVGWVVEKDYVYIRITSPSGDDANGESATWSGSHGNGKFAITTDLGRTLVLQITQDGALAGVDTAQVVHNGSQWEIAIPVESLPENDGGISFGFYQQDAVLSGNIPGKEITSKTDISYDGNTGEWAGYPHTLIQYATAGTQENVPDGESAIYTDNYIYGHCETVMQAHLNERGTEFASGVTVAANIANKVGNTYSVESNGHYANEDLHMRLVSVDEHGNINWNPDFNNLANGSYEYYIFDTSSWGTSKNISSLNDADVMYGKATIIVSDTKQEMEWYVMPEVFAQRYGIEATEIKTVSAQYGRIGQEWASNAGTSTGPAGSVALASLFASIPMLKKSKFILKLLGK